MPPDYLGSSDPILPRELPVIQKIIEDETWLEGERRGCLVPPHDPVVCDNVCQVVLRIGSQLRQSLMGEDPAPADAGQRHSGCWNQAA
jgi:hypothetical protein